MQVKAHSRTGVGRRTLVSAITESPVLAQCLNGFLGEFRVLAAKSLHHSFHRSRLLHVAKLSSDDQGTVHKLMDIPLQTGKLRFSVMSCEQLIEPFSSWLGSVELQCVDGLGDLAGFPWAAAELVQDVPRLELGVCPFSEGAEFRVGAVGLFLRFRLVLPLVGDLCPGAALVPLVREG